MCVLHTCILYISIDIKHTIDDVSGSLTGLSSGAYVCCIYSSEWSSQVCQHACMHVMVNKAENDILSVPACMHVGYSAHSCSCYSCPKTVLKLWLPRCPSKCTQVGNCNLEWSLTVTSSPVKKWWYSLSPHLYKQTHGLPSHMSTHLPSVLLMDRYPYSEISVKIGLALVEYYYYTRYTHTHLRLIKVAITCELDMTWWWSLHQLTSLTELQKALEAHGCKPWVTNLSIIPYI